MKKFSDSPIVGVTGTFYNDSADTRFEVSLETAERWRDTGLPLVVVDGSPEDDKGRHWAEDAYRARGATVLQTVVPGIASQRQQGAAYVIAEGGEKIITHEPEKPSTPAIASDVADLLDEHSIVVVGRTERSKETLPPVQKMVEDVAGWVLERTLNLPPDALAGPRGYNTRGMKHLLAYPSHEKDMNNWIYMYHNPLAACAAGESVGGVAADLMYDAKMTEEETGNPVFDAKRYEQFRLQLRYLLNREEVAHESLPIAYAVLSGLDLLPAVPSNNDYAAYFSQLQVRLRTFGYNA